MSAPKTRSKDDCHAHGRRGSCLQFVAAAALCFAPFAPSSHGAVLQVTAGADHTCAIVTGGILKCWGANAYGQLGDGTFANRGTPVDVVGLDQPIRAVSAGAFHTCAITATGGVKCWGQNDVGQLGDGSSYPRSNRNVPVDVVGLSSGIASVAAGGAHTCAVTTGGEMSCWGGNGWGQLGDGTPFDSSVPVRIRSHVASIAAGAFGTAAVATDGRVVYWGVDGQKSACSPPPFPVCRNVPNSFRTPTAASFLPVGVTAVSSASSYRSPYYAASYTLCAIAPGGRVMCWGGRAQDPGHLATDETALNTLPDGVTAISMGGDHACVLGAGGVALCWGENNRGQLGRGVWGTFRGPAAPPVELPTRLTAIAAGGSHTCALTMIGDLRCWGSNSDGQLGIGPYADRNTPTRVLLATEPNYQGLWWNAPAASESGWGISFAHQGDTIFATWFTYESTGAPLWLAMVAAKSGPSTYAGTLFTASGPPFDAVPFEPARVVERPVGTATLAFADEDHGTFAYTIDSASLVSAPVSQTKNIVRMKYSAPPGCAWGVVPDLAQALNYQDLWWASPPGSESGWGIGLTHQGDTLFATWYTFDTLGEPLWLIAVATEQATDVFGGPVSTVTGPPFDTLPFDPAKVVETVVGSATFTFLDGNRGTFAYDVTLGGKRTQQAKTITRMVFAPPGTICE